MKTLPRMVIVFIALNLITAGFCFAQFEAVDVAPAQVTSEPVEPVPQVIQNYKEEEAVQDLLVNMTVPSSTGRAMFSGSSGSNSVFIVPNREIKAEELLKINEDINVMSRIFEDKLNQVRYDRSDIEWSFVGNRWRSDPYRRYLGFGSDKTGCMYLQGYGALFLMNVDFPLSALPETEKQQEEKPIKENVDQVWEKTRQQIYEPQETSLQGRGEKHQEVKYDAEKVEKLKTTLIESLKHAANIRILKPDESVIISIQGIGVPSNKIVGIIDSPGTDQKFVIEKSGGKQVTKVYTGDLPEDLLFSAPTVLVIRAKKIDIDSFAEGSMDLNGFRQCVQILSYPLLSESVAGAGVSDIVPSTVNAIPR